MNSLRRVVDRLMRARAFVFFAIPALVCAIALMCLLEVTFLEFLLATTKEPLKFVGVFTIAIGLMLFLSIALSLLCLQLTEAAQAAGLAETAVFVLFAVLYASVARQSLLQPLLFLVSGKILVTLLLARFWHAKFRDFRMRFKSKPTVRFFMEKAGRFFSCAWVVLACWFMKALAFSLALVESQSVLQLQGWEGVLLLATFFCLFWVFVRNPHAHPETFEEA
jgi:hypothetical protein